MIDHITIKVANLEESAQWYDQALAPLGYARFSEEPGSFVGFCKDDPEDRPGHFWMFEEGNLKSVTTAHIAFAAQTKEEVHAFYKAALAAGGVDNGAPGFHTEYGETYYGAFVFDPNGNNIEAVTYVSVDSAKD